MAAGLAATVLCGSLAGCGSLQELTSSSKPLDVPAPAVATKARPATATAAAPAPSPARASGPLDTGTVTHRLKQGTFSVQLTYWTADDAKAYTAGTIKTINVAAHVEDTDNKHRIEVSTFQVTQDDGVQRTEVSTDSGKFDVTPPYPYNTVVTLPAATAGATQLTLSVRLDLLVETEPDSNSYYRSTALDTLTLPLLTNGAAR